MTEETTPPDRPPVRRATGAAGAAAAAAARACLAGRRPSRCSRSAVLLALVSDQLTLGPSWLPLAVVAGPGRPADGRQPARAARLATSLWHSSGSGPSRSRSRQRDLPRQAAPARDRSTASYLLTGAARSGPRTSLTFALWYWEIDGGGPSERRRDGHVSTDFLFPQLQIGDGNVERGWWPGFLDYMFVAFNASTAFSPTDTLILSRRAKVLMMVQALIAVVTVVVIAARAINTLG